MFLGKELFGGSIKSGMSDDNISKDINLLRVVSPARLGIGRSGTRPKLSDWIKFRADHARAKDAVNSELSAQFLELMTDKFAAVKTQSLCKDRSEYVRFPPRGKICRDDFLADALLKCKTDVDVQIVLSDGLSAKALEENAPELLPILLDGLEMNALSYGTPVVASLARVAIGDMLAHKLRARLVINLIGERPGLSCAESLSAYITLNPGPLTISSDRTVVSNIHKGGTPPLEAGAYIVELIKKIFRLNSSGVRLQQAHE